MFFRLSRLMAGVLVVLGASASLSDLHSQAFQCTEAVAGQLSAQADVACECRFFRASAMAGTPAGYRWDCGIFRPRVRLPVLRALYGYYPIIPFQPFITVPPQLQPQ